MTIRQRLRRWWVQVDGLARRVWPREAEDFLARGLDRHLKGDLAGAIADYDRAIAGYPDRQSRAMAYLMRGNVRRDQGDLAGAIADYDRSIAGHPGQAGAHLNRAVAYEEVGDRERAVADYRIVGELSADPGWRRQAAEGLGRVQMEELTDQGRPKKT
jgi:tetratricopeptide (TPR) repeat protein